MELCAAPPDVRPRSDGSEMGHGDADVALPDPVTPLPPPRQPRVSFAAESPAHDTPSRRRHFLRLSRQFSDDEYSEPSSPSRLRTPTLRKLAAIGHRRSSARTVSDHHADDLQIIADIDKMAKQTASLRMADLTFERRLGEGGFAVVDLYHVSPCRLKASLPGPPGASAGGALRHPVALKRLKLKIPGPPLPGSDECTWVPAPPSWRLDFLSEAVLLRALRHENVVACYGVVKDDVEDAESRRDNEDDDDAQCGGGGKGGGELRFLQEYCDGGVRVRDLNPRHLRWWVAAAAAQLPHATEGRTYEIPFWQSLLDRLRRPRSYSALQALRWLAQVRLRDGTKPSRAAGAVCRRSSETGPSLRTGACSGGCGYGVPSHLGYDT